jgi:hypothetical protein
MPSSARRQLLLTRLVLLLSCGSLVVVVQGHPLCLNFEQPLEAFQDEADAPFCKHLVGNTDGNCCTEQREWELLNDAQQLYSTSVVGVTAQCDALHRQVACSECHPWVVHLTEFLSIKDGSGDMLLKGDFCTDYMDACGAALGMPKNYCTIHTQKKDGMYSYPFVSAGEQYKDVPVQMPLAFPMLKDAFPTSMVGLYPKPGKQGIWWVLDQFGIIYDIRRSKKLGTVVDISAQVLMGGERGLLSMAFAPDFETSGHFYVLYFSTDWHTRISRLTYYEGDPYMTAASESMLFQIGQPSANHNGGSLLFHPDDLKNGGKVCGRGGGCDLYITTGDGGGGYDFERFSQNLNSFLGKILRIKVPMWSMAPPAVNEYGEPVADPPAYYTIPPDNVFAESSGLDGAPLPEIYSWGMRNPWRCSFDGLDGQLWCADVGQQSVEEIDIIEGGLNYGWNDHEGTHCTTEIEGAGNCDIEYAPPIYEYCHETFVDGAGLWGVTKEMHRICDASVKAGVMGRSITGGLVYRGKKYADTLGGSYLFADYESRLIAYLTFDAKDDIWKAKTLYTIGDGVPQIVHFAEDEQGEVYIVPYDDGNIYAFECGPVCETQKDPVEVTNEPIVPTVPKKGYFGGLKDAIRSAFPSVPATEVQSSP